VAYIRRQTGAGSQAAHQVVVIAAPGIEWRAVASDIGEYRLVLLPPGVYDLQIERAGFERQAVCEIFLSAGGVAVINIR
jgi:hypothetical protein